MYLLVIERKKKENNFPEKIKNCTFVVIYLKIQIQLFF